MWKRGPWRWPVVAAAFLLSLSAMVGAQRWYVTHLTGPALASLEALPGVEDAWLEPTSTGVALRVRVSPVEDVPGLVASLRRAVESGRLGRVSEVVMVDRRNEHLSRVLTRLQIALQEGAFSGNFTEMERRVHAQSAQLGVPTSRVYVDGRAVYLFLQDGDAYLYEVVARPAGPQAGPVAGGAVGVSTQGPQAGTWGGAGS